MIHSVSELPQPALAFVQGLGDRAPEKSEPRESLVRGRNEGSLSLLQKAPSPGVSVGSQVPEELLLKVQESLRQVEPRIQISVEQDLNRVIMRVVDNNSGELIRQIPAEEVLKLQRFLHEKSGLLIEEQA